MRGGTIHNLQRPLELLEETYCSAGDCIIHKSDFFFVIRGAGAGQEGLGGEKGGNVHATFWARLHHLISPPAVLLLVSISCIFLSM